MSRYTKEIFIEKAKKIHGDKYDYSKVEYINSTSKVCIICPEHGEFWQSPSNHLANHGCPKCATEEQHKKFRSNSEEFIKKAREVHGDKYDYSKVEYFNNEKPVCIICPEHGEFWQTPRNHLNGAGCFKCGKKSASEKQRKDTETFINEANLIHGNKYNYSKSIYSGANKKVLIICPEHGEFWQTPSSHINSKNGCPICGRKKSNESRMLTKESFIAKAKEIHRDKYSYDKVVYNGYDNYVTITCKKHGDFLQTPDSHLQGHNCPQCSLFSSEKEEEIFNFCKTYDQNAKNRARDIISPYEIDIFLPSYNLGIEYNGILWHSEKYKDDKNYHLMKLEKCRENGIRLIQIFEDEYINHRDIVLSKILHAIDATNGKKIMARKTIVKTISKMEAKSFLDTNHIQGFVSSTVYLGCFFENELVGVMTFKKLKKNENKWELTRFAGKNGYICQGIGGKLFKYFLNNYEPLEVKSFADRRWTTNEENNLYTKLGFNFDSYIPPDYKYMKKNDGFKRIHKFNIRKSILHKKYGLPLSMTEREMATALNFYRIYDCGLIKYVWRKEK